MTTITTSRDAAEGIRLYEKLYNKGIELVFLKEPHISASTYKKALQNNVTLEAKKQIQKHSKDFDGTLYVIKSTFSAAS